MKKAIISIFVFCSAFFVFSFDINAATSFNVNISDGGYSVPLPTSYETSIFNYFEEQKNNTDFYQMLIMYGENIQSYLTSLSYHGSFNSTSDNIKIFIFTLDEIIDFCNYTNTSVGFCSNYYSNASHVILMVNSQSSKSFYVNDNTLIYNDSQPSSDYTTAKFYYFNESTFLGSNHFQCNPTLGTGFCDANYNLYRSLLSQYKFSYNWIKSGWWIFGSNTYDGTDFSYLYSKFYYGSDISYFGSDKPTINIGKTIFKNVGTDMENLSSSYYLDYLKKNSVISSTVPFKSLLSVLNYKQSVEVPNTYSSQYFGFLDNVTLFPISACSLMDYGLYVYSDNDKSFNLYLHQIEEDSLTIQGSYYSTYDTVKDNVIKFNPLRNLSNSFTTDIENYTDSTFTLFSYRFEAYDNKSEYIVYYNPNCYAKSYNYESVTFVNPNTGNSITYDDNYKNWSDPENDGAANSINFFDNPSNYDLSDFNLTTLGNKFWSGAKNFIGAGVEIVSLSTVFFDSLPKEVSSIILTAFIVGILLLLIGLIKKII